MPKKLPDQLSNPKKKQWLRVLFVLILITVGVNLYLSSQKNNNLTNASLNSETYTSLIKKIDNNEIANVTLLETTTGAREITVTEKNKSVSTIRIPREDNDILVTKLLKQDIPLVTINPPEPSVFWNIFMTWGPTLLLVGVFIWLIYAGRADRDNPLKAGMAMGGNKAKLINPNDINVTFDDVVGCDAAKKEISEVVDFLKNPSYFSKTGAEIPCGILLVGPAGTGKTLLAKAIAKESNVPFFSTSGSEFMEMFVGIGPSRVRSMFEQAKEASPSIIFIDEIDAIGGARGSGVSSGGNSEREQTLNQILVELDGLDKTKTVILIAATNRPEMLDKALLRPGRIDRQIAVDLPDVKGREKILELHSKNVPLAKDIKLGKIALGTPGFSGAELKNIVNEAAILAARRKQNFVTNTDFEEAKSKIMMGLERPNLSMTDVEKQETAYHESGHAVIARLVAENGGSDPVHKVTIIPRGGALGVTVQLPEKERYSYDKSYLTNRITILMGGRAAEEIFCNKRTAGASQDISVATKTATSMVCEWGMSSLGPIAFGEREGNAYLGGSSLNLSRMSPQTAIAVESEIHAIINNEYAHALELLKQNADIVEAMTAALMEIETIDEWQIDNLMARRHHSDPIGLTNYEARYNKKFVVVDNGEAPEVISGADLLKSLQKPKEPEEQVSDVTENKSVVQTA